MTTAIPFPRQFQVGDQGPDCRAVKRALVPALEKLTGPAPIAAYGMDLSSVAFEEPAGTNLQSWKTLVGLEGDPIYTLQAHQKLEPFVDAYGRTLFAQEVTALAAAARQAKRKAFLAVADLTVAHEPLFRYTETLGEAPGTRDWFRVAPLKADGSNWQVVVDQHGPLTCDCSAHYIGCGEHAGIPSSIAHGVMDGDGATGALLADLTHIEPAEAQAGDGVVFVGPSSPAGVHVTILHTKLAMKLRSGDADWQVVNMGGAGEPAHSTLSAQAIWHAQNMGAPTLVYVQLPVG